MYKIILNILVEYMETYESFEGLQRVLECAERIETALEKYNEQEINKQKC